MKLMKIAAVMLSILSSSAFADQCAIVSTQSAAKAIEILEKSPYIIRWCQACGEQVAVGTSIEKVRAQLFSLQASALLGVFKIGELRGAIAALRVDAGFKLEVDNKNVDLAYLYVIDRTNNNAVTNLGALAGCGNKSPYYLPEQQSAQVLLQILVEEAAGKRH